MSDTLTLPESLILLALNDETGAREGQYVNYALAGAGLAELAIRRVLTEAGDPPNRFVLASVTPTGDAFLDGCMAVVQEKGIDRAPKKLINDIANIKGLVDQLLDNLVSRGVLRVRMKKVFFFFEKKVHPEAQAEPERILKERLAAAMFNDGSVEARDVVLIALAKQTGLLQKNFDRGLLKEHRKRIDEIASGHMLATSATVETINAIQTAIMIAVIVPVLVS